MDTTGVGDPIYDDLRRAWGHVEPVKFTAPAKVELIQRLIVAIEQRQVAWPAAWTTLTDELRRFEYALSPSGAITYSAPAGYHDDCVIALALANRGRFPLGGGGSMSALPAPQPERRLTAAGRVLG